ncbi:MAG: T9SS type A sorting domain-containing protein [candidate division WOR-3 bacterium]|nr:MAG: T9SS type A sorting domain-containing protein [candidate division WOR-3 bacterium]
MKTKIIIIAAFLCISALNAGESMMLVRIQLQSPEDVILLDDMNLDRASLAVTDHIDVVVSSDELLEIQRRGFTTSIIQHAQDVFIPTEYHTVEETWAVLDSLHQLYPAITELDTCGYSQRIGMPIPLFTISNNVGVREDEPAALIDAMHHAREPIGNEICIHAIKWILDNYPDSIDAQRWVDSMELQFIPIVNPEGWQYILDNSLTYPWWRKNLRDNGNNGGPVNPDSDGVDLNRNYDWRWEVGGSADPTSWVYRGPSPHSESEVQALVDLALERKYLVGITYHSYGYDVFYPGRYQGQYTPDVNTLLDIAQNMCFHMNGYTPAFLDGYNMSAVWFYGRTGTYDFLIETALSFIPHPDTIPIECEKNFAGMRYLFNRTFYSGIAGHVRDSLTLQPLEATVEVVGLSGDTITPRTSDSLFGRFYRLLTDGNYSMRFYKPGYVTKTISDIPVTSDSLTQLDVLLVPAMATEEARISELDAARFWAWPNPFTNAANIRYVIGDDRDVTLKIYDISGKLVRDLSVHVSINGHRLSVRWDGTDDAGRNLPGGIYFSCLKDKTGSHFGKLIMMR